MAAHGTASRSLARQDRRADADGHADSGTHRQDVLAIDGLGTRHRRTLASVRSHFHTRAYGNFSYMGLRPIPRLGRSWGPMIPTPLPRGRAAALCAALV